MSLPTTGWKNKEGTGSRTCKCGSWKQHWINFTKENWPSTCSVEGCNKTPTLGAHIINPQVSGERIAPMCEDCNKRTDTFTLKSGVVLSSANTSETCD